MFASLADRLRTLPRDTRDTWFLLAVIAWVVLPHVDHLPAWCSALTGAVLLWRGALAWRGAALPGRWVPVILLLAAAAATFYSHKTLLGRDAGVTMVVVLLALKTLELRARRDAFVVFYLGLFTVLTNFLYSQSLPVALAMVLAVLGLLTALVGAHMPVGVPTLRQASGIALRMAMLGAPVMALLFILFPRVGPLWGLPSDALKSRTGLSQEITLGDIAELAQDDSIAMRVKFNGPPPSAETLYFRGPVLSSFDGRQWLPAKAFFLRSTLSGADLQVFGAPVDYEVTLEPNRLPWILVLDATPALQVDRHRVLMQDDLQWRSTQPVVERLRYRAASYPAYRHGPTRFHPALLEELELPTGFNPRSLQFAAELRRDPRFVRADARTLANHLLQQIRSSGYTYTLAPGTYGRDAIDEFWLDRKEGFCEHFAAAFVVLMRALGIPARIVTGYQGVEFNPVDGYYVVRQSHAHAWAEYWQRGEGWVRADPTAAVAPDRIVNSRPLPALRGVVAAAFDALNPTLMQNLRHVWGAFNNGWNQWVLNYSKSSQTELLKNLGFQAPDWEDLLLLLFGSVGAVGLAGAAWTWWSRRRQDPWLLAYGRIRRSLQGAGVASGDHMPPRALAQAVERRFGAAGESIAQDLLRLEAVRYANLADAAAGAAATTLARKIAVSIAHRLKRGLKAEFPESPEFRP